VQHRGAKGAEVIESVVGRNVLPVLGEVAVHKLTTRRLADWHRARVPRPIVPHSTAEIPKRCDGDAPAPLPTRSPPHMAQSGHANVTALCLLSGVKQTGLVDGALSAADPQQS